MSIFYEQVVAEITGQHPKKLSIQNLGGGCIHQAVRLDTDIGQFFVKSNKGVNEMFASEAKGLKVLRDAGTIGVPQVLGQGTAVEQDYLCLEFIDRGPTNDGYWSNFGEQLAALHDVKSEQFGLDHDNYIGRLHQSNRNHDSWVKFMIHERLIPQLDLALTSNLINAQIRADFDSVFEKLNDLIPSEQPALLHGDLWSGNVLCGPNREPYIFDPAVYFGHREAELAFTKLFGGFDSEFYSSYHSRTPLQPGYEEREDIFNLYPLMVHVNLFGQSYLTGIIRTLKRHV